MCSDGFARRLPPIVVAASFILAAMPALSQGAMTPRPDVAPRVAPAPAPAPQAPVTAPPMPLVAPADSGIRVRAPAYTYGTTGTPTGAQPGTAGGKQGVNVDSSNRDHIDQDAQTDLKKGLIGNGGVGGAGGAGIKQAPSRAPLPAGYVYDKDGRIVAAPVVTSNPGPQKAQVNSSGAIIAAE